MKKIRSALFFGAFFVLSLTRILFASYVIGDDPTFVRGKHIWLSKASSDGRTIILTMTKDKSFHPIITKLFNKIDGMWQEQADFNNDGLFEFEFSPDGKTFYFTDKNKWLLVAKKQDSRWEQCIRIADCIEDFKISPGGDLLVAMTRSSQLIIFKIENGDLHRVKEFSLPGICMRDRDFLNFALLSNAQMLVLISDNQSASKLVMFEEGGNNWDSDGKVLLEDVYGFDIAIDGGTIGVMTSAKELVLFENRAHGIKRLKTLASNVCFFKFSPSSPFSRDNQILLIGLPEEKCIAFEKKNDQWLYQVSEHSDRLVYKFNETIAWLLQKDMAHKLVAEDVIFENIGRCIFLPDQSLIALEKVDEATCKIMTLVPSSDSN